MASLFPLNIFHMETRLAAYFESFVKNP